MPSPSVPRLVIAGGGAAGFFTAIQAKECRPEAEVILLEKSREVLAKVAISGGGRCNVTHHCFDPAELIHFYPRGARELRGPFSRWNPEHTVNWFTSRGVPLKTEKDGRMFPVSDSSQSIVDCLRGQADALGVKLWTRCGVQAAKQVETGFQLGLTNGDRLDCTAFCLATGGNRGSGGLELAASFGHRVLPPVPSLFSFHVTHPFLKGLSGIAVDPVAVTLDGGSIHHGSLLITHQGVSGPAVLKLSAWEARRIAEQDYRFELRVNWLPGVDVADRMDEKRVHAGAKRVLRDRPAALPRRLWERCCEQAGIGEAKWSSLSSDQRDLLVGLLIDCRLPVKGKTLNKDEFVTCGGVDLREVNMKRFESRLVPGLFFAGEVLDIDGVTGGFNFQAAWTGGFHAGTAMGGVTRKTPRP